MSKLTVVAALLASAAVLSSASSLRAASSAGTGAWSDLFQPPYTAAPGIMMAISCITESDCYVPGGQNGAGFNLFRFDGAANGVFTVLGMEAKPLAMMAIGLGGTYQNPRGAVGGFGIGNGVQYAKNATYFESSIVPSLFVVTQDIRASQDGGSVLVVDNAGSNAVLFSGDAGYTFSEKPINTKLVANCTAARYAAIVDDKTWYVTMGSWPNTKKSSDAVTLSERVSVSRCPMTGKITRHSRKFLKGAAAEGSFSSSQGSRGSSASHSSSGPSAWSIYTAQIVKTTDGGNTWTTLFEAATNFYFNGIDCASATHCFAVGEGFDANPAAYIYETTDGKTWNVIYTVPSSQSAGANSLMSIVVGPNGVITAAGGTETSFGGNSLILQSSDNGKTWVQQTPLPNIVDISDVSVLPSGYIFATAMTVYQDSTILKFTPGNAPPSPPAPTQSFFTQMQCQDTKCTQGCQNATFPAGACLQVNGGGSALVHCTPTKLVETVYTTNDCSGTGQANSMALDTCLSGSGGGSFENFCGTSSAAQVARGAHAGRTMMTDRPPVRRTH